MVSGTQAKNSGAQALQEQILVKLPCIAWEAIWSRKGKYKDYIPNIVDYRRKHTA